MLLQEAFHESGQYPDAVFSAHAHHYQHLTYHQAGGRQIPCLIVGGGGNAPIEPIAATCGGQHGDAPMTPCTIVLPTKMTLPTRDRAQLVAYNSVDFGFLRVTLDGKTLTGEHFAAYSEARDPARLPVLDDFFTLDLSKHTVQEADAKGWQVRM